jgi:hypothetical protein
MWLNDVRDGHYGDAVPQLEQIERTARAIYGIQDGKASGLTVRVSDAAYPDSIADLARVLTEWTPSPGARLDFLDPMRYRLQDRQPAETSSGGGFHRGYPNASQQAFLEAQELAFQHFGGVFGILRFDNLKSAVKKILRGHQREETSRFIAFRSHWGFQSEFCNPARGNEKGGVEEEGGYFRRNHLVPLPVARDLDHLNELLLAGCKEEEQRVIAGRSQTIGAAMAIEREYLLPLAAEGFDLAAMSFPLVNSSGCVNVLTNFYSAPLPVGTRAAAKVHAAYVEIWHEGKCVARHERCFGRRQKVLNLEHYLDVLVKKPGALAGSMPLEQWRQGRWPASFDQFWSNLEQRRGKTDGTRAMIEVLLLGRDYGFDRLRQAVEQALAVGGSDVAIIRYLLKVEGLERRASGEALEVGWLSRYERPLPNLQDYDRLLRGGGEVIQ